MDHTCPTAAPEAGCSLMPQPSLTLLAMPFAAGFRLLLPCACQQTPSYAGAILSRFQTSIEAGLSRSGGQRVLWDGSHPQPPAWCVCSVPGEREQGQLRHHGAASPLHTVPVHGPSRKTVSSILDILTKWRECPPWFCLDLFHGAYFRGWLWLLTLLQMA